MIQSSAVIGLTFASRWALSTPETSLVFALPPGGMPAQGVIRKHGIAIIPAARHACARRYSRWSEGNA